MIKSKEQIAWLDGVIQLFNPDFVHVTSDHHFGHVNIIKYSGRPFSNVEEMDAILIEKWNNVIGAEDIVFHLGDFTLGGHTDAVHYFSLLNGNIHIVKNLWHHDRRWLSQPLWVLKSKSNHPVCFLPPMAIIELPGFGKDGYPLAITLCHYPLAVWDRKHYGAWHCHGHSHGAYQGKGLILDVGVDCHDFAPVSLATICERLGGVEV